MKKINRIILKVGSSSLVSESGIVNDLFFERLF